MIGETQTKSYCTAVTKWMAVVSLSAFLVAFCGGAYANGVNSSASTDLPIGASGQTYMDLTQDTSGNNVVNFTNTLGSTTAWINPVTGKAQFSGGITTPSINATSLTSSTLNATTSITTPLVTLNTLTFNGNATYPTSASLDVSSADTLLNLEDLTACTGNDVLTKTGTGFTCVSPQAGGLSSYEVCNSTGSWMQIDNPATKGLSCPSGTTDNMVYQMSDGKAYCAFHVCSVSSTSGSSTGGKVPTCAAGQYLTSGASGLTCANMPTATSTPPTTVPTCAAGQYVTADGNSFSCEALPSPTPGATPLFVQQISIPGFSNYNAAIRKGITVSCGTDPLAKNSPCLPYWQACSWNLDSNNALAASDGSGKPWSGNEAANAGSESQYGPTANSPTCQQIMCWAVLGVYAPLTMTSGQCLADVNGSCPGGYPDAMGVSCLIPGGPLSAPKTYP